MIAILLIIFMLCFIFYWMNILMNDDNFIIHTILLLGMLVNIGCITTILSPYIYPVKTYCYYNHISYDFVSTVATMTETNEMDVAQIVSIAKYNELELSEVISFIDPELTEEEIDFIIKYSDKLQAGTR